MGVGPSDSTVEMDRELEEMGKTWVWVWGGGGGGGGWTGVGAVSGSLTTAADFQFPRSICLRG